MTIHLDPEGAEVAHLLAMAGHLEGKQVLEIGCGSGRMTWRYAGLADHVVGIDHNPAEIAQAKAAMTDAMRDRVTFKTCSILDFEPESGKTYDVAIFSWAL